jgi:phosphohistidine phosphatase
MKLSVMRHGPAEEEADSGIDADRALTAAGRERVRNVAKALLESAEEPVEVIMSPLVRAVQTAEIVAVMTTVVERHGAVRVRQELAPGGDGVDLAMSLASGGRRRVLIVGHEPDLSALVSALLGAPLGQPFDKAMIVGLQLTADPGSARLRFVLDPKTLRLERAR